MNQVIYTSLNERSKADRQKMADGVLKIIAECGATGSINPEDSFPGPRELAVPVSTPRGLKLLMEFDGDSPQPNVYVLSWYMDHNSPDRLNPATFGVHDKTCGSRKATYIAYGYEDLVIKLRDGLTLAMNGEAFV